MIFRSRIIDMEKRTSIRPDDINSLNSSKKGLSAIFENVFRKFQIIGFGLLLFPIALLYIFCIGASVTPGIMIYDLVQSHTQEMTFLLKSFSIGLSLGAGFVCFVFVLIFVVPLVNLPLLPFVKSYRGQHGFLLNQLLGITIMHLHI